MKLSDFVSDGYAFTLEQDIYEFAVEPLPEGLSKINFGTNSSSSTHSALSFVGASAKKIVSNPFLLSIAGVTLANAVGKWQKQAKSDIFFSAMTSTEKKFYEKMVKDLVGTGKYHILKASQLPGSGYEWILRKK